METEEAAAGEEAAMWEAWAVAKVVAKVDMAAKAAQVAVREAMAGQVSRCID